VLRACETIASVPILFVCYLEVLRRCSRVADLGILPFSRRAARSWWLVRDSCTVETHFLYSSAPCCAAAARTATIRLRLCASTYHSTIALTLTNPRTRT